MIAIGHVRGAEQIIDDIAQDDSNTDGFVQRARALLEEIDLQGIRRLIKEARSGR